MLVFELIVISGCKKDGLTKATTRGKNTFSCKINGHIFKPFYSGGLFNGIPSLEVGNNKQYDFILSARNQETSEAISIENPYITKAGVYKLIANHPHRGIYEGSIDDPGVYTTDSIFNGQLTITRCDTNKHIYSGTFFFIAIDHNTGRTVHVTDGRFDVKDE